MKIELVVAVTAVAGSAFPRILLTTAVVSLSAAIPWIRPERQEPAIKVLRILVRLMETVTRSPLQIAAAGFSLHAGAPDRPARGQLTGKEPDDGG